MISPRASHVEVVVLVCGEDAGSPPQVFGLQVTPPPVVGGPCCALVFARGPRVRPPGLFEDSNLSFADLFFTVCRTAAAL